MDYWKKRELIQRTRLLFQSERKLKSLLKSEYNRLFEDISEQLRVLLAELGPESTAADLYRADKYYKLLNNLESKLTALGNIEVQAFQDSLSNYYVDNQALINPDITLPADDERVLNAINSVWCKDGKTFSDRIWANKTELVERLRTGLVDVVAGDKNWGTLSKQIRESFGTAFSESKRLVVTELSHIQNKSAIDKYRQDGVKKVRFISEPDCCEHCREKNGKIYDIDKAPIIPRHPNCKCAYLAVLDGDQE